MNLDSWKIETAVEKGLFILIARTYHLDSKNDTRLSQRKARKKGYRW